MSIERWKNWFESIALVVVIGSLIAVVVELRQTQTSMRAQAYQARAFDGIEWNLELAKNETLRGMQERLDSPGFDPATFRRGQSLRPKLIGYSVMIQYDYRSSIRNDV